MIDIHSHIIPGIDDGAASIEEALEMARIAEREGIEKIICTPHFQFDDPTFTKRVRGAVKALNLLFKKEGLFLRAYPGTEAFLRPELLDEVKKEDYLTLNGSEYVLVEFPLGEIPMFTDEMLYELRMMGKKPIIAHPERYREVMKNPDILRQWIQQGNLVQVNGSSILGMMGKRTESTVKHLLTHRMVHLVASDSHSMGKRSPYGLSAYKKLEEVLSKEEIQTLMMNSERVFHNKRIIFSEPIQFPKGYSVLKRLKHTLNR